MLRNRILSGETVVGSFVKTPAPHMIELLALAGLDFVVADQEHAPLDLTTLDGMVLAGRAAGIPVLVRTRVDEAISAVLDLGAAGVMVPHVDTAQRAHGVAAAVKFAAGKRGFSPSVRAGGYGTRDPAEFRSASDAQTVLLAQIEDAAALGQLDAIAATPGVDALFIGPSDLSLSLGFAIDGPEMTRAIAQIATAARQAGKAAGLFVSQPQHIARWAGQGINLFVCGSDQSLLLSAARQMMQAAKP